MTSCTTIYMAPTTTAPPMSGIMIIGNNITPSNRPINTEIAMLVFIASLVLAHKLQIFTIKVCDINHIISPANAVVFPVVTRAAPETAMLPIEVNSIDGSRSTASNLQAVTHIA